MASYTTDHEVFVTKTFSVLVFLWRDSVVESFVFVLRHRETVYWLLNGLKDQEVCVCDKRGKGRS
jgi:hypothetical protein